MNKFWDVTTDRWEFLGCLIEKIEGDWGNFEGVDSQFHLKILNKVENSRERGEKMNFIAEFHKFQSSDYKNQHNSKELNKFYKNAKQIWFKSSFDGISGYKTSKGGKLHS